MDCQQMRPVLSEAAAGAPLPATVAQHVENCSACRGWLDDERVLLSQIDGVLAAAMAVEPSPGFRSGVRRRIAEQPPAVRASWLVWVAAAGLAALVVGAFHEWPGHPVTVARHAPSPGPIATTTPFVAPLALPSTEPPQTTEVSRDRVPRTAVRAVATPSERRPARIRETPQPPVIVPAGQGLAIQAYYNNAILGRVTAPPPPAEDLSIAVLDIKPLPGSEETTVSPGGRGDDLSL